MSGLLELFISLMKEAPALAPRSHMRDQPDGYDVSPACYPTRKEEK